MQRIYTKKTVFLLLLPKPFPAGFGSLAAPQMAYLMVKIHHGLHFLKKAGVQKPQPVVNILVHAAFAQAEAFGRLAHGISGFDDMTGQHDTTGLDLMPHPFLPFRHRI